MALRDSDIRVGRAAAEALGKIGDAQAVRPLIEMFNSRNHSLQMAAADALRQIGRAAVEPLVAAFKDLDCAARRATAEVLGKMGDPHTVMPLVRFITDETLLKMATIGVNSLGIVIQGAAARIAPEDLHAVADLDLTSRVKIRYNYDRCNNLIGEETSTVDYWQVRRLARQELIRRGHKA